MTEEQKRARNRAAVRKWAAANQDKVAAYRVAYKKRASVASRKSYEANREKVLLRTAKRQKANRAACAAYSRKYREANPGAVLAYSRAYEAANKTARRVAGTRARLADPERARAAVRRSYAAHRPRRLAESAARAKAHPEYYAASAAKRRAAKLQATPPWSNQCLIGAIYERAQELGLHVDHVIPLKGKKVCGLHVPFNLQLLTKSQNSAKGNRFHV